MNELIEIIATYVSIWAPSLVAIIGIVITLLSTWAKTKAAYNELSRDTALRDVKAMLVTLLKQNEELSKENRLLLDQITKIKGYSDFKE